MTAFGVINCGPKDWVKPFPFDTITVSSPTGVQNVFYSKETFSSRIVQLSSPGEPLRNFLITAIEPSPQWNRWFDMAENGECRIGFFLTTGAGVHPGTALSLLDGNGDVIDTIRADQLGIDVNCVDDEAQSFSDPRVSGDRLVQLGIGGSHILRWMVVNDGDAPMLGGKLRVELPEGISVGDVRTARGLVEKGSERIEWDYGMIAPGRHVELTMEVTASRPGTMALHAVAESFKPVGDLSNDSWETEVVAERITEIRLLARLSEAGELILIFEGGQSGAGILEVSSDLARWTTLPNSQGAGEIRVAIEEGGTISRFFRFRAQ